MRTWESHEAMVRDLRKPGDQINAMLTPARVDLWHAVTGVVTEAGELMDAVKKIVIYNKEPDGANLREELGDLEFYLEQTRQACGITREETLVANMAKLGVRYASGYNDQSAQARVDKAGEGR